MKSRKQTSKMQTEIQQWIPGEIYTPTTNKIHRTLYMNQQKKNAYILSVKLFSSSLFLRFCYVFLFLLFLSSVRLLPSISCWHVGCCSLCILYTFNFTCVALFFCSAYYLCLFCSKSCNIVIHSSRFHSTYYSRQYTHTHTSHTHIYVGDTRVQKNKRNAAATEIPNIRL